MFTESNESLSGSLRLAWRDPRFFAFCVVHEYSSNSKDLESTVSFWSKKARNIKKAGLLCKHWLSYVENVLLRTVVVFCETDDVSMISGERIKQRHLLRCNGGDPEVPRPGDFEWTVFAMCDSYAGGAKSCKIFGHYIVWWVLKSFCFTCLFLNGEDYEVVWCFLVKNQWNKPHNALQVWMFRATCASEGRRNPKWIGLESKCRRRKRNFAIFQVEKRRTFEGLNTILVCISPWILQRKHDTMI